MKIYMFPTVLLSIIKSLALYTQQCYMSAKLCDIYHCCVYSKISWWWRVELPETCRVSFQE